MEKKKLIMVAGPAGVGKSAVCKELFKKIVGSAWLDGDWCWMVNPYPGKTAEQKTYAEKAFGYILDGYFNDDNTNTILFSWLIHSNFMFELVTNRITYTNYELVKVVLICDEQEHALRMLSDNREEAKIAARDTMDKYLLLDAIKIDTTHLSVHETAEKILSLLH
ncbi:MAG: AAA family ATPase [Clostridiaceae bacterium]|nr:AAA family ATPase [Eubacteriales bacterium]